jgi:hypothetical protein
LQQRRSVKEGIGFMNKLDITHFIELLQKCKEEGCTEIIFKTEPINNQEINLTITQQDNVIIISTKKALY